MIELSQKLFGFHGTAIDASNWESVYDLALAKMQQADWANQVLRQSKIEAVFLTNDFDDPLQGFDTRVYIPCLRTDELVFHLARPTVRQRLAKANSRRTHLASRVSRLHRKALRSLSLQRSASLRDFAPPYFSPQPISFQSRKRPFNDCSNKVTIPIRKIA